MSRSDLLGPIAAMLESQGLTVADLAGFTRSVEGAASTGSTIGECAAQVLAMLKCVRDLLLWWADGPGARFISVSVGKEVRETCQ